MTPARVPLSAAQRGVWFAHQMDPTRQEYTCAEYIAIDGPLDLDLFATAWSLLRAEADVTRIVSVVEDAGWWQTMSSGTGVALPLLDFTPAADPVAEANRWMRADTARRVDLESEPISLFALLKVGEDRFFFYCRVHHVVIDGYGVHLLGRRLAEIYTSTALGLPDRGAPLGPVATLVGEDAAYRSSPRFAEDREYWRTRFGDRPDAVRLPASAEDEEPGGRPHRVRRTTALPRADVDRLKEVAATAGTTWQVVFIAAVGAYVHRVTGRRDVILGLPVTGRRSLASRRVAGMATNTVALRFEVTAQTDLAQLLPRVTGEVRDALRHERYRLEDIRADLGLTGGRGAFIGPIVNFMPYDRSLVFGEHRAVTHNLASGPVPDLSLTVRGTPDGTPMSLVVEANRSLRGTRGLHEHSDRFTALGNALVADPHQPIGTAGLLFDRG